MKWASRKAATTIRDITSWRKPSSAELGVAALPACWKTKTEAPALRFFLLDGSSTHRDMQLRVATRCPKKRLLLPIQLTKADLISNSFRCAILKRFFEIIRWHQEVKIQLCATFCDDLPLQS